MATDITHEPSAHDLDSLVREHAGVVQQMRDDLRITEQEYANSSRVRRVLLMPLLKSMRSRLAEAEKRNTLFVKISQRGV